jgi:hypothetical protein
MHRLGEGGELKDMAEMTRRERIMAASRKGHADRLPFLHCWRHSQIGLAERECRNRGMGISWARPCYIAEMHNVECTEKQDASTGTVEVRRTYSTPVGSVYLDEKREPGVGQWHAQRSWKDVQPWAKSRLIKQPEDYEVVKYMVENTEYIPDYFPIEQAKEWLGDDGVVMSWIPKTPMSLLMIEWIGSEEGRFYIHHARYRDKVEELYEAMSKSLEPLYEIAARSPADIIWIPENLEGYLVNPRLFEKYFMPEYEKCARVLHEHGKLLAAHMDGRLGVLKDLIAKTPVDIIEALHPPPVGDMPISEALSLWKEKAIWVGYPGAVYTLGPEAVRKHALELLRSVIPADRLVIVMSSENLVSNDNLLMLASVLENAELPLTEEKIQEIERSLS